MKSKPSSPNESAEKTNAECQNYLLLTAPEGYGNSPEKSMTDSRMCEQDLGQRLKGTQAAMPLNSFGL
jgi:hypothetical protein